jgi:hypothetical protein
MATQFTYVPIATQTLTASTATITFSSIPQTYNDLVLVIQGTSSAAQDVRTVINGDSTTSYSYNVIYGNGTTASASRGSNYSYSQSDYYGYPGVTNPSTQVINYMNYSSTSILKTILSRASSSTGVDLIASVWRSTAAITSLAISVPSYTWSSGSIFTLYGIAGA